MMKTFFQVRYRTASGEKHRDPRKYVHAEGAYRRRRRLLDREDVVDAWVESPEKPDGLALYDRHYRDSLETEA